MVKHGIKLAKVGRHFADINYLTLNKSLITSNFNSTLIHFLSFPDLWFFRIKIYSRIWRTWIELSFHDSERYVSSRRLFPRDALFLQLQFLRLESTFVEQLSDS